VDGSCKGNPGPMKISIVVQEDDVKRVNDIGYGTNNVAEYRALLSGLLYIGCRRVDFDDEDEYVIKSDSKLVVEQVNGNWRVRDQNLKSYCEQAIEWIKDIGAIKVEWIPRERNLAGKLL